MSERGCRDKRVIPVVQRLEYMYPYYQQQYSVLGSYYSVHNSLLY